MSFPVSPIRTAAGKDELGEERYPLFDSATGGLVIVPTTVNVSSVASQAGALTNRSGTITAGGSDQQIAASNSSRHFFFFQNVSDTDMWINFGAVANADQPSILVKPNGSMRIDGSFLPSGAVHVFCATTGKSFTCKEG